MDPLPGTYYFKGVILVRAADSPLARFRPKPKELPKPLRPPIAPLLRPQPLTLASPSHLRLVSIV